MPLFVTWSEIDAEEPVIARDGHLSRKGEEHVTRAKVTFHTKTLDAANAPIRIDIFVTDMIRTSFSSSDLQVLVFILLISLLVRV